MKATNNFAVTGIVAVSNPRTLGKENRVILNAKKFYPVEEIESTEEK